MGLGDFFPEEGGEEEGGSGSSPLHSQGSTSDKPGKRANPGRKPIPKPIRYFFGKRTVTHSVFGKKFIKWPVCKRIIDLIR